MRTTLLFLLGLTALAWPRVASAEKRPVTPAFAVPAVPDAELAWVRGGQAPFAALTWAGAVRMSDAQFWADMRQSSGITRVSMDVWWGSTGAALIATSVRASP